MRLPLPVERTHLAGLSPVLAWAGPLQHGAKVLLLLNAAEGTSRVLVARHARARAAYKGCPRAEEHRSSLSGVGASDALPPRESRCKVREHAS